MKKLRIAVAGSSGRMGRALLEAVLQGGDTELGGALEVAGSASLGRNAGELVGLASSVAVGADIDAGIRGCSALIDFTRPEGTLVHLAACRKAGVNLVIGTTGFSEAQKKTISDRRPLRHRAAYRQHHSHDAWPQAG
jgi:4-hydroxy-tetrahydrodipicolinate reductase